MLEQSTDRLATIPPRATKLVPQVALSPRGLAPGIPFSDCLNGLVVRESKAAREPTARLECAQIAVLTADGRRNRVQIPARPVHVITRDSDM